MIYTIKNTVTILLILVTFSCFSQKIEPVKNNILPNSIYTNQLVLTSSNTTLDIVKNLDLNSYQCYTNTQNIEYQNFKEIYKSGVYETYQKKYITNNLKKSFFKVDNLYLPHDK